MIDLPVLGTTKGCRHGGGVAWGPGDSGVGLKGSVGGSEGLRAAPHPRNQRQAVGCGGKDVFEFPPFLQTVSVTDPCTAGRGILFAIGINI